MTDYKPDATVRNMMANLGLDDYLNRPGVTEVMINRPGELFIEGSDGIVRFEDSRLTLNSLTNFANALTIFNGKHITIKSPMHSVTLPDGERGHIMMPPSCEDGTLVFGFRKPSNSRFTLNDYIESGRIGSFKDVGSYGGAANLPEHLIGTTNELIDGSLFKDITDKMKLPNDVPLHDWQLAMLAHKANRNLNAFFELAVQHKLNICMVGGTGSGKTTFTKAIADMVPASTRLVTIEDTHELDLPNHPNHLHLFFKEHITAKAVIASCMRLKPDRIFLTELRGDEAWDYLSALNTGHPGGLTSVHANDARAVYYRIAQLAKESATGRTMDFDYILGSVKATIDIVCFFEKTHMTELYFDPVEKFYAMSGRA